MKKIRARLEYIYNKLDGKKQAGASGDGPQDEFTAQQIALSEDIVRVRNKIQEKRKLEAKKEGYVQSIKLRNELKDDMFGLDESLDRLKKILEMNKASSKYTQKVKDDRTTVCNKFEELLRQLSQAVQGENVDIDPYKKPVMKLADIKNDKIRINTREDTLFGEDNPDDDRVINEWRAEDEKLDNKLGDVNILLDEIRQMNNNLADNLAQRDELIDMANKDAFKANKEIEEQNKTLAAVLKKYRAPGKFCLDICLLLVLLGLIAVIIMLAINGKM